VRSERVGKVGNALPTFSPSIGCAFRLFCLRTTPRKVACFRYFRSDYPLVSIVIECRYLELHESVSWFCALSLPSPACLCRGCRVGLLRVIRLGLEVGFSGTV
jgi:hypothetical protein